MWFSSISLRQKSNSVSDAEGKQISISLNPIFTRRSKNLSFVSIPIGSISAWFPSLKSTEHHIGAFVIRFDGH